MDDAAILDARLRAHLLTAPAATVLDAAAHMVAVQAQEFWGGRWALAVRAREAVTIAHVDAAFDRGDLVRAWTMRGTLHIIRAADLGLLLAVTRGRQQHQARARHGQLGLDDDTFARAEVLVRSALAGGGRLSRAEFAEVLSRGDIDPAGQRGIHILQALAIRGVLVLGPVVPREGGPSREQYIVLREEWGADAAVPLHPEGELFARFIASHGPASARDFAWWTGLTLGQSRAAAAAASDRVVVVDAEPEPRYVAAGAPAVETRGRDHVFALPPFEEYYISYTDRHLACAPEVAAVVGPGKNGMVRPVVLARGRVVGVWTHSLAMGRHRQRPTPELLVPGAATEEEVAAAIGRYSAFVTGEG